MTTFKFPPVSTKQQIDPALLTFDEYKVIANEGDKWHSSSAYDHKLSDFNREEYNSYAIGEYPKLLQNLRINGIAFQVRVNGRKIQYCKRTPNDEYLRDAAGNLVPYSDEEITMLGLPPHDFIIAVFETDSRKAVAAVQDEWGCVLIKVAREYRGFGLGPLLTRIARRIEPDKPSGGFTQGGFDNFKKVHAYFVREALGQGLYRRMVADGQMTMDRVREIVGSIKAPRDKPRERNLGSADPKDWLLYVGGHGDFVLYDRKVREMLDADANRTEQEKWDNVSRHEHWIERMILGIAYASGEEHFRLMQFGGVSPKVRTFLMCCALEHCRREGETLWVEGNEPKYVRPEYGTIGEEGVKPGFRSREVTPTGKVFDYDPMGKSERLFRAQFDRHGEFRDHVEGLAYAKFEGLSESSTRRRRR